MNYLKQLMVILLFTFGGEVLHALLPFPVPGSIYGLLLLFLCLEFGAVKAESIRETAMWLVEMIPVMFVPAGAGLLKSWGVLRPILWQVAVITAVSTVAVMVVSGKVTQGMIFLQSKRNGDSKGIPIPAERRNRDSKGNPIPTERRNRIPMGKGCMMGRGSRHE